LRKNRLWLCAAGAGTAATLISTMPAFAAELVAAELVGTPGRVDVQQGSTVPFTITLSASGALECGKTATATVPTSYTINAAGAVSPSGTSNPVSFTGTGTQNGGSGNCDIQGGGQVAATVTVDAATPAGTYKIDVEGTTDNTGIDKGKLEDKTAQSIDVVVSPSTPTLPTNHAPTVKTAATDANGVEGDTLTASGSFQDADNDKLTLAANNTEGKFTDNHDGTWMWSLATNDDVHPFDPSTIIVTADDGKGGSATDSFDYSAVNANPVVEGLSMSGDNCSPSLGFSVSDPGTADTHDGTIEWGDGSTEPFTGSTVTTSHHFVDADTYTVTVNVNDDDGGTGAGTVDYDVYNIPSGIFQPINLTGRSAFKLGSTIPVKITVANCAGTPVSTLTPQVTVVKLDGTPDGLEQETVSTASPTSGTTMRWDATGQQYIYNLGTKGLSVGDFKVRIDDDSFASPVTATFSIKK
jgi:hypothetical protein